MRAGKSTLSDCLLELTGNISAQEKKAKAQFTDTLKVERERGITVKAQTASMIYNVSGGKGGASLCCDFF